MAVSIVFSTGNEGKVKEIRKILDDPDLEIRTLKEAGLDVDPEENGETFEANALIKARAAAAASGCIAMADDSGLVIDALDGEPGVQSARYLGHDTSYTYKNHVLLERMKDVPEDRRTARFVCAAACVFPDGREFVCRGVMEGRIAYEPAGENGFGYDPIFYLPDYGMTSAQITPAQKNAISHRGKALAALKERLYEELGKH